MAWKFNPGVPGLARLNAIAAMYSRFRIRYMNIAWKPACSAASDGSIVLGIFMGKTDATKFTEAGKVLALKPSFQTPVWKPATLSTGGGIDSQRYMMSGVDDNDGVSFTLIAFGTAKVATQGVIQVSYEVELAYPHP